MPKCYICNYYDSKRMSIFRIPNRSDEYCERAGLWLKLLDEKLENVDKIRICSDHFLKKKPAKTSDFLDVDWIPNKNLGRFSKNLKVIEYHLRKMNKPMVKELPIEDATSKKNSSTEATAIEAAYEEVGNNTEMAFQYDTVIGEVYEQASASEQIGTQKSDDLEVDKNTTYPANVQLTEEFSDVGPTTVSRLSLNSLFPLKKRKVHVIEQKMFLPKEIQTNLTASDIDFLFQYYKDSVEERSQILLKISTLVIDVDFFKSNDKKTRFYTGLTKWTLFSNFYELVKNYLPSHFNCKLSQFQMLALTLMKLRLNLTFTDLGYRFQVDETTASRYFHRCIYILEKLFNQSKLLHWPDRSNLLRNVPNYFRSTFKEVITIIVDCFELFIERSSMLKASSQSFSQYKHHTTLKFLIGISITGVIIFVSKGFGGRASDKVAVNKSKFLDHLQSGDVVLADKGFLVRDEVEAKDANLILPCFVNDGKQLHPTEVEESRHVASIRIHVERIISVVRQKYNICSDTAQMSAVAKQNDLFNYDLYDKIVFICCCLVNICPSVVNNDFEM